MSGRFLLLRLVSLWFEWCVYDIVWVVDEDCVVVHVRQLGDVFEYFGVVVGGEFCFVAVGYWQLVDEVG